MQKESYYSVMIEPNHLCRFCGCHQEWHFDHNALKYGECQFFKLHGTHANTLKGPCEEFGLPNNLEYLEDKYKKNVTKQRGN